MELNGQHITIAFNMPAGVRASVQKRIKRKLSENKPFALYVKGDTQHAVLIPAIKKVLYSTGETMVYSTSETFMYALWLILYTHQEFYDIPDQLLPPDKPKLIIL